MEREVNLDRIKRLNRIFTILVPIFIIIWVGGILYSILLR
jgi:hypothetical protein